MKKLKVMTVVGTRPEIIRLSRVMLCLDRHVELYWMTEIISHEQKFLLIRFQQDDLIFLIQVNI